MAVFKDIYQKYAKDVYRFLLSLTGNGQEAEELLAETFYQAFLHIDSFEWRSSIYTWLCQIGKNAWIRECKRKKRFCEQEIHEVNLTAEGKTLEAQFMEKENYSQIMQEVYQLQEPYREVFILHVLGEMKLKDIAALFAKSEEWARVTYYRAKSKLAKAIQRKGLGGKA